MRDLYQASPKASISSIRTALAEMLDIDVPSETAICRRSKSEGWTKTAKKQCNFTSMTLKKKMQQKYNENNTEVAINEVVSIDLKPSRNRRATAPLQGMRRVYSEAAFLKRKTAEVILGLRKDSYVIGQYQSKLLDDLIEIEHNFDNFNEYFNTFPKEFEGMDEVGAKEYLLFKHSRTCRSLGLVESLTTSLEKRAKIDFALYGINPDDTRDSASDGRIVNLEEDQDYYAEQERISKENQEKIAQRMAELQSGRFEEIVRQEAMQKAQQHELNEDVEDGEFSEIND